jgi:cell division protein FtsQ
MSGGGGAGQTAPAVGSVGAPRRSWKTRFVLALLGIAALLVLVSPLWAPLLMRRMAFFRVRRVEILGAHYVAPSDILTRLNVDTSASIWNPTKPLASRIATFPEIQTVDVGRKLPGTLVVRVTERVPVALVPANAGFRAYDARGVALPIDLTRVTVDAPIIAQRDTAVLRLLGAIRSGMPALYFRVSEVRRTARDELLLRLKTRSVRVRQDITLERLAELTFVEEDLARRNIQAAEIDLRFRDQVIARLQ